MLSDPYYQDTLIKKLQTLMEYIDTWSQPYTCMTIIRANFPRYMIGSRMYAGARSLTNVNEGTAEDPS
jgi:hypothetical protein